MSRFWTPPWEILEATEALEIVINHQCEFLQLGGEPFYLLQRRLVGERVVVVIDDWRSDPDVGHSRGTLWHADRDNPEEFPDRDDLSAVLITSAGARDLVKVPEKDLFTDGQFQYALEYRQGKQDPYTKEPIPDAVFVIVNEPPHNGSDPVRVEYRSVNSALDFHSRQPSVDNQGNFAASVRGYRQWLDPNQLFRGNVAPHVVPLAMPDEQIDLSLSNPGFVRSSLMERWTSVPPYVPVIVEHDILVRAANDAHYEVTKTNYDWGLGFSGGQSRLKQQSFSMTLLDHEDPKSRIPVVKS